MITVSSCAASNSWNCIFLLHFFQLQLQKTQYLQLGQSRGQYYGGSLPNVNQIGNSAMDLPFQVSSEAFSLDLVMNSGLGCCCVLPGSCCSRRQHPGLKPSGGVGMCGYFFMLIVDFSSPVPACEALGSDAIPDEIWEDAVNSKQNGWK